MTAGARALWCEHALLPGGVAHRVAIEVDAGRFARIAADADPPADAERRPGLTLPGIANAHSHAFHRVLRHRSQSGSGSFWTWREQMYRVAAALDPDRYHRLARAAFAEMVLAGYTAVGEFHYVHHRPDGRPYADPNAMGEALIAAAADAGLRITLLDTVYLHGGLGRDGHLPLSDGQRRFADGTVERWAERVERMVVPGHARQGAAIHSVRAVDPEQIAQVAAWAAERGAPLHAHVSEQPAENEQCLAVCGSTPVGVLAAALGPMFTAVHATHVTGDDIHALGSTGSTVCLCPTTERDLGDGVGPARALLDAGAPLAIGSDSHAVVDPFEEARAIELDERLVRRERGVLRTVELLSSLTGGHRCLGWVDAGAIEVGRRADLVTVRLTSPRLAGAGVEALAEAAVFSATSADVTDVTVDGVDVVGGGRHLSIDVAAELRAAIAETLEAVP